MRHLIAFACLIFAFSANAQWQVVPSGTDSALYSVSYKDGVYFAGGEDGVLLKSVGENVNFIPDEQDYGFAGFGGITKIGIVDESTLFFQSNFPEYEVADPGIIYSIRSGVSVRLDSNLVIVGENDFDVVVDTAAIPYYSTEPFFLDEGEVANVGTISWVLRSGDLTESYDLGTVFPTQTYITTTHTSSAKNFGAIDFSGNLFFSSDSGMSFISFQTPGFPYCCPADELFLPSPFYFNDDLIGFYGPAGATSSLYKIDLESQTAVATGISGGFKWNDITMIGDQSVIAVGDSGMIATSEDQGDTWSIENAGTERDLYGVASNGLNQIIVVGDSGLILINALFPIDSVAIIAEGSVNEITTANGTLQLTATVYPETSPQSVDWSMVNLSGTATIDQTGLVTAQGNGLVMAVAEIAGLGGKPANNEVKSNSSTNAVFFIQISGQSLGEQYLFGSDTTICGSDVILFNLDALVADFLWSNGTTGPTFEINSAGHYWVTITDGEFIRSDSIFVNQSPYPEFSLGQDLTACLGDQITLTAPLEGGEYLWSTGAQDNTLTVMESGEYALEITINGCTALDEIMVTFQGVEPFDLGDDTTICEGETTTLTAPIEGDYLWSTGSSESAISVGEEGWYVLEIFEGECGTSDSLFVFVDPLPQFSLGADTVICDTASIVLDAFVDGATYLWSNGSEYPSIEVFEAGTYSVIVAANGCSAEDEITLGLINCSLSTSLEILESIFQVYPNPATDLVTIEIPEKLIGASLSVFSPTGKLIRQFNQNSTKAQWDISGLPKGFYLVRIGKDGVNFTKELVIQ
jgi:hypothetical protein